MQEQELQAANAEKLAAEDEAGCLQLPPGLEERVFLVDKDKHFDR